MAAYGPDVVSKYDARTACLAGCAAGLRCRVDALFADGSKEVFNKLKRCRGACDGGHVEQPGYLEKTKKCLSSGTCESFAACAPSIYPAKM